MEKRDLRPLNFAGIQKRRYETLPKSHCTYLEEDFTTCDVFLGLGLVLASLPPSCGQKLIWPGLANLRLVSINLLVSTFVGESCETEFVLSCRKHKLMGFVVLFV